MTLAVTSNTTPRAASSGCNLLTAPAAVVLRNPKITLLALAVLAANLPVADAGPVTGLGCFITCMSAGVVATKGSMLPATVAVCTRFCAWVTACVFLP